MDNAIMPVIAVLVLYYTLSLVVLFKILERIEHDPD